MSNKLVGIDIGASEVKLAVVSNGSIRRTGTAQLPDDLVRDGRIVSLPAMAQFLKQAARENHIPRGNCALALPSSVAFFRRLTMPLMTVNEIKLNLPYEFRDFITREKDKYFYDYAVVRLLHDPQTGALSEMDLMAAAVEKSVISDYSSMLRHAGFKLKVAMPEELAYAGMLRRYIKLNNAPPQQEFCLVDLGHETTRVYIYSGWAHEATSVVETGGSNIDRAIADELHIDQHLARTYKLSNFNNVLNSQTCRDIYANIAVELQRVLNFYRYNNPSNELRDVYFCGGGAEISPLLSVVAGQIGLNPHHIADLLPSALKSGKPVSLSAFPVAYGITLKEEVE